MGQKTGIAWTDSTWNPVVGCTRHSEGCRFCYAFALHDQRHKAYHEGKKVPKQYALPFTVIQEMSDRLDQPLHWLKPQRIFVNSMSDLFHKDVSEDFILRVFDTMRQCTWSGGQGCGRIGGSGHTFQILTKRPERMRDFVSRLRWEGEHLHLAQSPGDRPNANPMGRGRMGDQIWLGVSVENQATADERLPHLADTPAAVKFVSAEPLLGPLVLSGECDGKVYNWLDPKHPRGIQWVIAGGESGPNARPCELAWIRSLVHQCRAAQVPCFVKQLGARASDPENGIAGRSLKVSDLALPLVSLRLRDRAGAEPSEWPEDLKCQEFPQ